MNPSPVWFFFSLGRNPQKRWFSIRPEWVSLAPPLWSSSKITSKNYFLWKNNPCLFQFQDLGKSHSLLPLQMPCMLRFEGRESHCPLSNSLELLWPPRHFGLYQAELNNTSPTPTA